MKITCPSCSTSYQIKAEAVGAEGRSVKCAKCGNRWFVSANEEEEKPPKEDFRDGGDVLESREDEAEEEQDQANWDADAAEDASSSSESTNAEDFSSPITGDLGEDESRFEAELEDDIEAAVDPQVDIESRAKRPKIIVNPDKFRKNRLGAIFAWLLERNYRRLGGFAIFGSALFACFVFVMLRDVAVRQSPDLASFFQMIGFEVNLRGLEFRNLRTFTEVEEGNRVLVVEGSIRNLRDETNPVPAVRLSMRTADLQEIYAWTVEPRTKSLNGLDETRFRTILSDPPENVSDIQVRFVERGQRQIGFE